MARIRGKRILKTFCIFVVLVGFLVYVGFEKFTPVDHVFVNSHIDQPCSIPSLDPFDTSIQKFFWIPDPLECDSTPALIYVKGFNTVVFNKTALDYFKVAPSDVVCEGRDVIRLTDDYNVKFSPTTYLTPPVNLTSDFVHVMCKTRSNGKLLYDNIVTGISELREDTNNVPNPADESSAHPSVLLFGIDSLSRSGYKRYLPKTKKFLDSLGAYEFKGYMKVGDGTLPNAVAMLMGKAVHEEFSFPEFDQTIFDVHPLVWKNFTKNKYVTLYAEDEQKISCFNNGYKGFYSPPTHHYMRPFWLAQSQQNEQDKYAIVHRFLEDKGIKLKKNSILCNKETPNHVVFLRYLKQFMLKYRNKRKFIYSFLVELGHDFMNFLSLADDDFHDFFKWMKEDGQLENTIVVVFADHGPRIGDIRNTFVGRVESRMPLMSILLPDHLKKKHSRLHEILNTNTERLTTAFDVHETLLNIAEGNFDKPTKSIYKNRIRGMSLFQHLPEDRSCADAGIPENFCACFQSSVTTIDAKIVEIGGLCVDNLNKYMSDYPECKKLSLLKVHSAQLLLPGLKYTKTNSRYFSIHKLFKPEENRQGYIISIETVPGNARFDVTCEYSKSKGLVIKGHIDRTNMYGNQSYCVTDKLMKQYCFCDGP